jgi:hypothetical protein
LALYKFVPPSPKRSSSLSQNKVPSAIKECSMHVYMEKVPNVLKKLHLSKREMYIIKEKG